MFNEFEEKWMNLLTEGTTWCTKYEVFELLDYMASNSVNINTLSLQRVKDSTFILRIDKPTLNYYKLFKEEKR